MNIVPGTYRYNAVLAVPGLVTLRASAATDLYGRMSISGGGITVQSITLDSLAAAALVTVTSSNAALTGIALANPDAVAGAVGVSLGSTSGAQIGQFSMTGLAQPIAISAANSGAGPQISDGTIGPGCTTGIALGATTGAQVTDVQIDCGSSAGTTYGINLAAAGAVVATNVTIAGVSRGIYASDASTAAGAQVIGGSVTLNTVAGAVGIGLGTTTGARLTAVTITGASVAGASTGLSLLRSVGAQVTDTVISGVQNGISTSATNAGAGPVISGGSISVVNAAAIGISLGETVGASVTATTITGPPISSTTSYGINVDDAASVAIEGVDISGVGRGVFVAAASTAVGPSISDSRISGSLYGVTLGATTGARILTTTITGASSSGTTVGVSVQNAADVAAVDVSISGYSSGVLTPGTNTNAGLVITDCTVEIWRPAPPPSINGLGISLGAMTGAVLTRPVITATPGLTTAIGLSIGRAPAARIVAPTISGVTQAIAEGRVYLAAPMAGAVISDARLSDVGSGIYLGSSTGAIITNAVIDSAGEAITGHEAKNVTITSPQITGHPGPAGNEQRGGSNGIRFYYSANITVTDAVITGGSTALYWDMTDGVLVQRATVSDTVWWATYTEGVTDYTLTDSSFTDNYAIGNLTINPSVSPPLDVIRPSGDVLFTRNSFVDNPRGLYLPLGAYDVTFADNTVTGQAQYVIQATPVHGLSISDNDIAFTPSVPTSAAISVTTLYDDVNDPGSASSTGVSVTGNRFTGPGPFLRVGAGTLNRDELADLGDPEPVSQTLPEPPPPDADGGSGIEAAPRAVNESNPLLAPIGAPEDARALRETIEVSENVFPQPSIAIVTLPNAEVGTDSNTDNALINGNVAVDAREETEPRQNDWGAPCGPRVAATGWDGGGAFITEVRTTQVLYPELCGNEASLTISGAYVTCRGDLGYLQYDISLTGVPATPEPRVAVIWWEDDVFPHRDASILPSDSAGILADGADAVQYLPIPAGWQPDDPLVGEIQVSSALVDAKGIALRDDWTLEFRVNPSAAIHVNPPTGLALCPAAPAPAADSRTGLASSGWPGSPALPMLAVASVILGAMLLRRRGRSGRVTAGSDEPPARGIALEGRSSAHAGWDGSRR
ncbi:right-handed parallel beta-helix repeat-containing protein [Rathayibacter sp. YIM 133350]